MRKQTKSVQRILLAGMLLMPATAFSSDAPSAEKTLDYRFSDGVIFKVHYTEKALAANNAGELPSEVLDAAVAAYQTITEFEGFDTPGFSFAEPDKKYAYDPDKTIDIYLGEPSGENHFEMLGTRNSMFKDAPCFDAIPVGGTQYQAVILLPANYRDFIKSWEKINPSPMGGRNMHVDLRGTLIHEMLHTIVFYYNKNLNKSEADHGVQPGSDASKDLDWYVEGLARYFETFAGARHDFFSQGFKQTLPDRIRFSRGGSNYFMRYPDQPFTRLRYENALFWRFMDDRYGMKTIEALSRAFRGGAPDFRRALEKVTGEPFERLLQRFARSVLDKDFGLKEDAPYLNDIARTRVSFHDGEFFLLDGKEREQGLGKTVATDWIGRWEDVKAGFESASVAGDATDAADVSGWATDFIEITFGAGELPKLRLSHDGQGAPLYIQMLCVSKGGSVIQRSFGPLAKGRAQAIDLGVLVRREGLGAGDIEKVQLMVTNSDAAKTAAYSFRSED